jgi:hypothetical protein
MKVTAKVRSQPFILFELTSLHLGRQFFYSRLSSIVCAPPLLLESRHERSVTGGLMRSADEVQGKQLSKLFVVASAAAVKAMTEPFSTSVTREREAV